MVVFQPLDLVSDLHVVDVVSASLEWIQSVERSISETPQDVGFNDQYSCLCLYLSPSFFAPNCSLIFIMLYFDSLNSPCLCLSQCSSECGRGSRKRTVTCTNPQGLCDPVSRPAEEEMCEDHSKCYEWKTGEWSKVGSPNSQKSI